VVSTVQWSSIGTCFQPFHRKILITLGDSNRGRSFLPESVTLVSSQRSQEVSQQIYHALYHSIELALHVLSDL
jgi:hypothetical protein